MDSRIDSGSEPSAALVVLPDRFRREGKQPERPPAERVRKEDHEGDGDEQDGAKLEPPLPRKPQPQSESEESQRHGQREIDEAVEERVVVNEQEGEDRGGRKPVVHLARDEQETGHGQHRNRHDDQLDRGLKAEDRPEKLNKAIDAEIADRCPIVFVITLQISGTGDVQLDPIPADMSRFHSKPPVAMTTPCRAVTDSLDAEC